MSQALGKPQECKHIGDYANVFLQGVLKNFTENVKSVDILFDRYKREH